jgi:HEAT repeat protein
MDEEPEDTPQGAARLQRGYFATMDADRRMEIITGLQQMSVPEAIQAVAQIIRGETDPDLKTQLISVYSDSEATPEQKLATFAPLILPGQPDEVREAALNALDEVDDPRAIPVLQGLLNDPNEDYRQMAADAIERLK